MKSLVEFFVKRPMFANLIIIIIFGFGIYSIANMRKEAYPEVTMGRFAITSIYPGASAEDVEINLTVPIENAIKELENIQEITSISREGLSIVNIVADENISKDNLIKLQRDIDNKINNITNLPYNLKGKPEVQEITSSELPIIELAFEGNFVELKDFIFDLKDELQLIEGVSKVKLIGMGEDEVHILVDPIKAKKEFVDLLTIAQAIRKRNLDGSGGTIKSFISEKKIVSYDKIHAPEEILNTVIRMSPDGYGVKLSQVAEIIKSEEDLKLRVVNSTNRGANLLIIKKSNADIIKTLDEISLYLENRKFPQSVTLTKLNDSSTLTRNRIKLVLGNALLGFILVNVILFLTFDIKTAFWTAFGIPFSMMGCMIFLYLTNSSLNMFVLGGFILVVGMLVDDAIVISDSINSYIEKGVSAVESAKEGVNDVWLPVLASSTTTMAAFSPLMSIGGLPGKFIWIIPAIVILCLIISLFESYFLLPVHLAHFSSKRMERKKVMTKLENYYEKLLRKVLQHKKLFLIFTILLFMITIFIANKYIKKDPFPQDASEGFIINVSLEKGSDLEKTEEIVKEIHKYISKLPKTELLGITARVGTNSETTTLERGSISNSAVIFVYLTSFELRKRNAEEIRSSTMMDLEKSELFPKVSSLSSHIIRFGPPLGKPFEVRVIHNDYKTRRKKVNEIKDFLKSISGVYDIDDDEIIGKDELNLQINHSLLSSTGLTVEDVLQTIGFAFEGRIVSDIITLDKSMNFRLKLKQNIFDEKEIVSSIPILNRAGQVIKLGSIITIKERESIDEYKHINIKRYTNVYGNINKELISTELVVQLLREKFISTEEIKFEYAGEPIENTKIFKNLGTAAIFAFVMVYLIISLIFNSYKKPFIVILAIPLGIVGVFLSIFIHGMAISMFVGIALIGLMGVIVNNSIIMVYISSSQNDDTLDDENIISVAKSRLRPILLTTITTIFGLLPTGYGIGGYDPVLSPMSLALSYGLLFGTLIILFFIPTVYSLTKKVL